MSKIPPQRIAASCNVFYLIVINHGGFVCGKDSKAWGIVQVAWSMGHGAWGMETGHGDRAYLLAA
ncbi:MAG: hypothetical protein WAL94_11610 [Bacteroidales bacterium]